MSHVRCQKTWVIISILSQLVVEKTMAPHSSTLAWKIPWTEEPGRLQSMGLLGVGHDWATSLSLSCIGEGNGIPLQHSCLENPRDGGAWWAAVYGVAQSRTWLKRLSSRSGWFMLLYGRNQHNIVKQLFCNKFFLSVKRIFFFGILNLIRSHLFTFLFIFITLGGGS